MSMMPLVSVRCARCDEKMDPHMRLPSDETQYVKAYHRACRDDETQELIAAAIARTQERMQEMLHAQA